MKQTFRDAIPAEPSGNGVAPDQERQAAGQMTARTIPFAGMADRVRAGDWTSNLDAVLGP
jgi:hypothetical protein